MSTWSLTLALTACMTTAATGAVIPVTDTNLLNGLTLNNWVCQPDSISSTVCGATLALGFNGTQQVALQVDNAHLASLPAVRCPIIAWSINGGPLQTHQLTTAETSVVLCAGVSNPTLDLFIKGMSPFEDRYSGDAPPNSVKITGLVVDAGGSTRPIALPGKVWLNIGDSIMSGDVAGYTAGQGRPANDDWAASDDARASYGYLLAQHYGYRETRLAYGGYDWGGGLANVPSLTTLLDQKTSTISRLSGGFLNPIPDLVLLNLGENGAPALTDVTQALVKLRSRVKPATTIVVMVPVAGTARAQIAQAFHSYFNSTLDRNAFLVDLGSISFATADGQHPTAGGHQTIYQAALPFFDSLGSSFPVQPATASAFVGEQLTFSALGIDQSSSCQWLKISGGVTNILPGATNTTLCLTNLQFSDSASYGLQASNVLGVGIGAAGVLTVSSLPAPVNNLITASATETGRGLGVFTPGWAVITNHSLIAGQAPSSAAGNFSLEAPGRTVNSLTSGDTGSLSVIVGTSGNTSSTNYVTCGNGSGAGSSVTYTLTGSPYGYDLTNISVYGGWADNGRDQQAYTVYYATVMEPATFVPLTSINYNPAIAGGIQSATRVMLQSATAPLATNVGTVKFDFTAPASENGYCGYNQIAMFGSVGAPVTVVSNPPPPVLLQTPQASAGASALDGNLRVNLIRAGQSSLGGVSVSHGPSLPANFTTAGLNDGSASGNSSLTYYGNTDSVGSNLPVTLTFSLNTNRATGGSALGYDISRIQALTGWGDSHLANQKFELLLSLKGGPFISYGTFTAATTLNGGNNSILQTLTTSSGMIARGVTAVRFVFSNPGGAQGGSGGTLIRELQVFGTPVVQLAAQSADHNQLQLTWAQGVLLEATNPAGVWVTNAAATSPFTISPSEPQRYYRVRVQ